MSSRRACLDPVLVIPPRRRVSPLVSVRRGQAEVASYELPRPWRSRSNSPTSAHRPTAERVWMPAQTPQPGDGLLPRRAGDQLGDRALLQRVGGVMHDRVDLAEILQQRDLRAPLAEIDVGQPAASDRPGAGGVLSMNGP